ncbi:unnamed protein product [Phytophthora fragariaefolia]|uniref:Unnamed protein product n=1 Tax=Phytophthora fragariaefolia TaxID=1490495 RepID=A0A9W6XBC8_9STRA|nr:unnamed protein product [Phytophthora fragariaefolia]
MRNALRSILQHHIRLAENFDQSVSVLPSSAWWVNEAVVYGITAVVNVTFVKTQARDILLSQQMAEINMLIVRRRSLPSIKPVVDETFVHGTNDTVSDKYWLVEHHLVNFVKDQGSYVTTRLDTIQPDEQSNQR